MGYKEIVFKGLTWTSAFRFATRGISLLKNIILARGLLNPSQFGVFGIGTLVLAFLEILTETGINVFLIQAKKDIREYIDSAWVVSIIRGTIISLFILISARFIAEFFNSPESYTVLLLVSLVPFIRGFINPAIVQYQKELQFSNEFYLRTAIFLLDASVSVIGAYITHSANSLVYGFIAGAILEVILSFILVPVRPKFSFSDGYLTEIFHHGKWVTGYGIFNYFAQQGDNIVVGKLLGTSSLGIYQMAYSFSLLPISEISDVVGKVTFPLYAKISDDTERLKKVFLKISLFTFIASLISGIVIYVFAYSILSILGEQWLPAVPLVKILIVYGVLRTIAGPSSALFLALSKQKYITVMTFLRFSGLMITIYPFVLMFGMKGAAYSAIFSVILETPVIIYFVYKLLKIK